MYVCECQFARAREVVCARVCACVCEPNCVCARVCVCVMCVCVHGIMCCIPADATDLHTLLAQFQYVASVCDHDF